MLRRHPKLLAVPTGAIAMAAASLALSGALASASPGGEASSPQLAAPSAAQLSAFPVLGRPATESDSVIRSTAALEALQEAQVRYAANPSLGRVVAATSAGTVAVVPGEGVLCLLILRAGEQAGSFCEPTALAATEGLGVRTDVNEERYALLGVFPASAGATDLRVIGAAGAQTPVQLTAQAGYAVETTSRPTSLRWSATGGTEHSRQLSWPAVPRSG